VLSSDAASVAATSFRERLLTGVSACCMKFQEKVDEEEAERLAPLVFNMPERDVCGVFGTAKKLVLAKLDAVMQASAPLCMRRSYGVLKTQHHLKHDARLQLGLFFKGIGVSMDDALAFWQTEFMHGGKTAEEFEKQYSYNFKHQYGQAGSHINYQPYACGKVIAATPDETCATGCPFKTCKSQELAKMLRQMKVSDETVTKALSLSQEQHYQLACSAVFEGLHGKELAVVAPHQYFAESRKHHKAKVVEEQQGDEVVADDFTQI
jgi:DNA primase large subunit